MIYIYQLWVQSPSANREIKGNVKIYTRVHFSSLQALLISCTQWLADISECGRRVSLLTPSDSHMFQCAAEACQFLHLVTCLSLSVRDGRRDRLELKWFALGQTNSDRRWSLVLWWVILPRNSLEIMLDYLRSYLGHWKCQRLSERLSSRKSFSSISTIRMSQPRSKDDRPTWLPN